LEPTFDESKVQKWKILFNEKKIQMNSGEFIGEHDTLTLEMKSRVQREYKVDINKKDKKIEEYK